MADNWWAEDLPVKYPPEEGDVGRFASKGLKQSLDADKWWADDIKNIPDSYTKKEETTNTENLGRLALSPQRLMALSRGVPGLSGLIPEPNLAKSDPLINGGLNATGTAMSMGAPSMGVSKYLASKGMPGLLPEIAGQSALGIGANSLDKIGEKGTNVSREDMRKSIIWGLLQGAGGPLAGKVMSPTFNVHRYTPEKLAAKAATDAEVEALFHPSRGKEAVNAVMNHPLATGLGGAALSTMTGIGHPLVGAAIGATVPQVIKGLGNIASNKVFHNPDTQAILNLLMQSGGLQTAR